MGINETGPTTPAALTSQQKKIRPDKLRRIRGWNMATNVARNIRNEKLDDGTIVYYVPSDSHPGVIYQVFYADGTWSCVPCPDSKKNGNLICKHIVEVHYRYLGLSAIDPPSDELLKSFQPAKDWYGEARRFPHVPYVYADGPAESTRRDHAIENEDGRVKTLSIDLGTIINDVFPPMYNSKGGRPRLPPGNNISYSVIRIQERKSIRRFSSDAKALADEGAISFAPCRNTVSKYASDPMTETYFDKAFNLTANPFSDMETDIIIDSTGFSSFYVSCWRDSERGTKDWRKGTRWFKLHIAIGRITKAILGFVITESEGDDTSEISQFLPLITMVKARGFHLRYVVADNIYLTKEAIAQVRDLGATLVGPLKPRNYNKTTRLPNPAIKSIHDIKIKNPDLYDDLCRARQPIEGLFSVERRRSNRVANIGTAVERKLEREHDGPFVFTARKHEIMARMIRYNLAVICREEHLRDKLISFRDGTVFSQFREVAKP